MLIAARADVNSASAREGTTPLHDASYQGRVDIISTLLSAGADVNKARASDGCMPLHLGSLQDHCGIVSTLISAGADVNKSRTDDGTTPLHIASCHGHSDIIAMLIAARADVNQARTDDGTTPMQVAISVGAGSETISQLLSAGADVNQPRTADGSTALHDAVVVGADSDVISTLLSAGADVNHARTDDGSTALHFASELHHGEIVSMLIGAGADVDQARTDDGETPLIHASAVGHSTAIVALCEAGAAMNQASFNSATALWYACTEGFLDCVQLLSSYGACRTFPPDPNADDPDEEETAESVATDDDHEALLAWLVSSREWSTPLHHLNVISAARARALLRGGADLHAKQQPTSPTPLTLAVAMRSAGDAPCGSAARLVLRAAQPWSHETHDLFPAAARERAVTVMLLGHLLAREPRFEGEAGALLDVWLAHVLPRAVERSPEV
jgi:ankyrin repeat protein